MFDNTVSMFRCVSLGIVIENKKLGSSTIIVTPHEKTPFTDGEMVERVDSVEFTGVSASTDSVSGLAFSSSGIEATWLPSTNRRTPPDVQRGEMVELWQMAGSDLYHWRSLGTTDKLRRLETVILGISANPDPDADGTDLDNMYFVEISSHNKTITLQTSKLNGEFCTYDFQFDMGNGKVTLQDDLGNYGYLDSKNTVIHFKNRMDTMLELNKRDVNVKATKDINMTAENNVDVKAKKITLTAGSSKLTMSSAGTELNTPHFKGIG